MMQFVGLRLGGAVLACAVLASCGGGGGSSGTAGAGSVTATLKGGASGVARSQDALTLTVTTSVSAGTFGSATVSSNVCGGTAVATDNTVSGTTLTAVPKSGVLPAYGSSCQAKGQVIISGANGGAQTTLEWSVSYTIEAAWWPPTFVKQGVKVYLDAKTAPAGAVANGTFPGQTMSGFLPAECKLTFDDCWKDAVRSGAVTCVETDAHNPNYPNRSIVFCSYRQVDATGKMAHVQKAFFADNGGTPNTEAGQKDSTLSLGMWDELVYLTGTRDGNFFQIKKYGPETPLCANTSYDTVHDGWNSLVTPCP